ncbi:hypothetical protein EDD85DRAFT_973040 [Armillaria nabsnona]|nr:hypothetical protein EDD85DRAFT_973040 [Armillaria nabsnona]
MQTRGLGDSNYNTPTQSKEALRTAFSARKNCGNSLATLSEVGLRGLFFQTQGSIHPGGKYTTSNVNLKNKKKMQRLNWRIIILLGVEPNSHTRASTGGLPGWLQLERLRFSRSFPGCRNANYATPDLKEKVQCAAWRVTLKQGYGRREKLEQEQGRERLAVELVEIKEASEDVNVQLVSGYRHCLRVKVESLVDDGTQNVVLLRMSATPDVARKKPVRTQMKDRQAREHRTPFTYEALEEPRRITSEKGDNQLDSESCVYRLGLMRFLGEVLSGGAFWLSRCLPARLCSRHLLRFGTCRIQVVHRLTYFVGFYSSHPNNDYTAGGRRYPTPGRLVGFPPSSRCIGLVSSGFEIQLWLQHHSTRVYSSTSLIMMANIGSEELTKQLDSQLDLKMTELTVDLEKKMKATVRKKEGEDTDVYKSAFDTRKDIVYCSPTSLGFAF